MQKIKRARAYNRALDQLRPISLDYNVFGYAPGSVLFTQGNTKVLCSVSMQPSVPPFLKGTRSGWLTAEYAMLPTATQSRTNRESSSVKRNGRSVEISRLIGRALRTCIDLSKLGERTILVDCDVLQADGSTRTACITAANYALQAAQEHWLACNIIDDNIIIERVAAVSVGIADGQALLDLDYEEDSSIDADFNIVLTGSGDIVEMQGAAENAVVSWQQFDTIKELALSATQKLFKICDAQRPSEELAVTGNKQRKMQPRKAPLFSIQNR